ncbi:MAG TPA: tyrosine-protein phosphatase [Myxococcota bacterium]|nr:tyrosine-protein phosphatase [Myxococcota bacterium]
MAGSSSRRVELEGCLNFRDLGGYASADGRTLRRGLLFRSDALHLLTQNDVARIRDELRIGAIVDLRSTKELDSEGRGPLEQLPIRFHHLPLFDGFDAKAAAAMREQMGLADRYFRLAEYARGPIASVVETLAESDAPAVYHCAAGKDRTGILSAVLLGILGVPDEVIVADYALTAEAIDAIHSRLLRSEGYQNMLSALPPDTMHAEAKTMISFLAQMRSRYGSLRDFAEDAGVSSRAIANLEERLLHDE